MEGSKAGCEASWPLAEIAARPCNFEETESISAVSAENIRVAFTTRQDLSVRTFESLNFVHFKNFVHLQADEVKHLKSCPQGARDVEQLGRVPPFWSQLRLMLNLQAAARKLQDKWRIR